MFAAMEAAGLVLNLHSEVPSAPTVNMCVLNVEPTFLPHLRMLHAECRIPTPAHRARAHDDVRGSRPVASSDLASVYFEGPAPLVSAQDWTGFDEFCTNLSNELLHSYMLQDTFEDAVGYNSQLTATAAGLVVILYDHLLLTLSDEAALIWSASASFTFLTKRSLILGTFIADDVEDGKLYALMLCSSVLMVVALSHPLGNTGRTSISSSPTLIFISRLNAELHRLRNHWHPLPSRRQYRQTLHTEQIEH
ncbi:hypothetical protein A0H81_10298 [Grifola frondosa]|uniref:DUF6533 domain-containing protein n=1 Tax=Grifola frondosa TaxID=5627 RepID=A0A1C7LYT3_GRIFR|nr:hypothetical protein A0H81_10298 [Grifola frondosa]